MTRFSILLASAAFLTVLSAQPVSVHAATPVAKTPVTKAEKTTAEKTITEKAIAEKSGPAKPAIKKKDDSSNIAGNEALAVKDTDENYNLPAYPAGARVGLGKMTTYVAGEEDTFLDIARHFGLGYVELRAANMSVDPWSPTPGTELVIPQFNLLPRAKQEGVVVNLGKMRLYYFKDAGAPPLTYAIGIGREGLATPTGETTIIRKTAGPQWYPTERMRKEKPWLPAAVPAGLSNPLGTHALYLGWPTFLIHGSNKPWGIGRRVSSGCMRMYPEDIVALFDMIPVGTKVTVVDQPILVGWIDDTLYLEANPSQTQSSEVEYDSDMTVRPLTDGLRKVISDAAGVAADNINWSIVEKAVRERQGYPIAIAEKNGRKKTAQDDKPVQQEKPVKRKTADDRMANPQSPRYN